MIKLYYFPLCPFSKLVKILLYEHKIQYDLIYEENWKRRQDFLQINPSGSTPVMIHSESHYPIYGIWSFIEFLRDIYDKEDSFRSIYGGKDPESKFKTRNITEWFCYKFYNEVTRYIFNEKIIKRLTSNLSPSSNFIRAAKKNVLYHIDYLAFLLQDNLYIHGDHPTLSDYAAATQISVLDYFNDIPWDRSTVVKEWYSIIKSKPSFQSILKEEVKGIQATKHYKNPDF